MKTFHITVNARAAYGDPVKEAFVGTYQTNQPDVFCAAFEKVVAEASKTWETPENRILQIQEGLKKFGFSPLASEKLFAPIG